MTPVGQAALDIVNAQIAVERENHESTPMSAKVMHYDVTDYGPAKTVIEIRFGEPFTNQVTLDVESYEIMADDPKAFADLVGEYIWMGLKMHAGLV